MNMLRDLIPEHVHFELGLDRPGFDAPSEAMQGCSPAPARPDEVTELLGHSYPVGAFWQSHLRGADPVELHVVDVWRHLALVAKRLTRLDQLVSNGDHH